MGIDLLYYFYCMATPLPPEPRFNSEVLTGSHNNLKIYYGANSWGRKEWIGTVYPPTVKEREFLGHYIDNFNAVELNATHYKDYSREDIKKWADKAEGREFVFCPKFPQSISHYSTLADIEDKTQSFLNSIAAFGVHLGPIFLKLRNTFSPKKKERLYTYLETLPPTVQCFSEVTMVDWFDREEYESHLRILMNKQIGAVIADAPNQNLNLGLSIPKCFIRYTPTGDLSRVQQWFDKIKEWGDKGLTEAYFFVQPPEPQNESKLQFEALLHFKELVNQEYL